MSADGARRVGPVAWVVTGLVVLALVAGSVVAWSRGALNGWLCEGECGPEYISAPDGLRSAGDADPASARGSGERPLDASAVRAAVVPLMDARALGSHVGFAAVGPDGTAVRAGSDDGFAPASTTKLVTAFTALQTMDPEHRFTTRAVLDGDHVVLVGGGDPYLVTRRTDDMAAVKRAELSTLAARTARALRRAGTTTVSLGYDTSLFTGPDTAPTWESDYVSGGVVEPISPLWTTGDDHAGAKDARPADATADAFAELLDDEGIEVSGDMSQAQATEAARTLASVQSATVAQIVAWTLLISDNEAAEVLLRQAAIAAGAPGSFAAGIQVARRQLTAVDLDVDGLDLNDGSGLSRDNRIPPAVLAGLVAASAREQRTSSIAADLPVGAFSGSLLNRFGQPDSTRGSVRAKTGTLTGVHSIAGTVQDRTGSTIAFAVMVDRTRDLNAFETQDALDDIASAVAACRCSR